MEWIENRKAENRKTPIEKTCLCGTVYFTVRDKKMCEACQEKQTKLNRNHRQKKYYKTNSITIKEKNKKINKDKYYAKSTEGKQLKRKCGTTKVSKEAKIVIAISRWIKKRFRQTGFKTNFRRRYSCRLRKKLLKNHCNR
jgi:hypothetical protein